MRKIKLAQFHQSIFIHKATIGNSLPGPNATHKFLEMYADVPGIYIKLEHAPSKNCPGLAEALIPWANVVVCEYEPEQLSVKASSGIDVKSIK